MAEKLLFEQRPWGEYRILHDETARGFQIKRIVIHPGHRLSLQSHEHRSEIWTVVSGRGEVTLDDKKVSLCIGDTVKIAQGQKHRMSNPGDKDLIFIEVQLGEYLGEDDIRRFEDDYQRN